MLGNHEFYDGDHYRRWVNQTAGMERDSPRSFGEVSPRGAHLQLRAMETATTLGAAAHGSTIPSNTSRYYSVDIGLVHLVCLDFNTIWMRESSEEMKAEFDAEQQRQLAWLKMDLAAANANRGQVPWVVVSSHFPLYATRYTTNGNRSDGGMAERARAALEPLFAEHGVDLYAAGHIHNYEAFYPTHGNRTVTSTAYGRPGPDGSSRTHFVNPAATIHVTSGNGGPPGVTGFMAPNSTTPLRGPWTRFQSTAFGYGMLLAENSSVLVFDQHENENDTVIDSFAIYRLPAHGTLQGGPNASQFPLKDSSRTGGVRTFWLFGPEDETALANYSGRLESVDLMWGAHYPPWWRNSTWNATPLLHYAPYARDPCGKGSKHPACGWGGDYWTTDTPHNLSWFQKHRPEFVVYQCDQKTPAGWSGPGATLVPLDISNSDVVAYQVENLVRPSAELGYDGMAWDNFGFFNSQRACGVFTREGKWVQKFSGNQSIDGDPAWTAGSVAWLKAMHTASSAIRTQRGGRMLCVPIPTIK